MLSEAGTVEGINSDQIRDLWWLNYKILASPIGKVFGHMLLMLLWKLQQWEIASFFSLFNTTEEVQHLRVEENQGFPLWECLAVEHAFLAINCLLLFIMDCYV